MYPQKSPASCRVEDLTGPAAIADATMFHLPTQGSSWGYLKSQFPADLSTFGDNSPEKRPKGSKNVHRIPPRRGFCGP